MPRVVVNKDGAALVDAAAACPVSCFHKNPESGEMVIDVDTCIDCGVCQMEAPEGYIVEETETTEQHIQYNKQKAQEWPEA